jgi:hypothetical protein
MVNFLFTVIGVIWGAVGLYMVVFPTLWRSSMTDRFRNPGFRFLVMEGIILAGLILVIGTTEFRGFWLWGLIGGLGIALASCVLGCSTQTRDNPIMSVEYWPTWLLQVSGLMMMSLAVLFGADFIMSGI